MASVLLLTSLLTLESSACVYSPFSIFGPSQQLQINHYSFCPFPRAAATFWISLGFLVGSMINHIVNTVQKPVCHLNEGAQVEQISCYWYGYPGNELSQEKQLVTKKKGIFSSGNSKAKFILKKRKCISLLLNELFWNTNKLLRLASRLLCRRAFSNRAASTSWVLGLHAPPCPAQLGLHAPPCPPQLGLQALPCPVYAVLEIKCKVLSCCKSIVPTDQ